MRTSRILRSVLTLVLVVALATPALALITITEGPADGSGHPPQKSGDMGHIFRGTWTRGHGVKAICRYNGVLYEDTIPPAKPSKRGGWVMTILLRSPGTYELEFWETTASGTMIGKPLYRTLHVVDPATVIQAAPPWWHFTSWEFLDYLVALAIGIVLAFLVWCAWDAWWPRGLKYEESVLRFVALEPIEDMKPPEWQGVVSGFWVFPVQGAFAGLNWGALLYALPVLAVIIGLAVWIGHQAWLFWSIAIPALLWSWGPLLRFNGLPGDVVIDDSGVLLGSWPAAQTKTGYRVMSVIRVFGLRWLSIPIFWNYALLQVVVEESRPHNLKCPMIEVIPGKPITPVELTWDGAHPAAGFVHADFLGLVITPEARIVGTIAPGLLDPGVHDWKHVQVENAHRELSDELTIQVRVSLPPLEASWSGNLEGKIGERKAVILTVESGDSPVRIEVYREHSGLGAAWQQTGDYGGSYGGDITHAGEMPIVATITRLADGAVIYARTNLKFTEK